MFRCLALVLHLAVAAWKSRQTLLLENLALRHQLLVLGRGSKRPRFKALDRAFWVWLSRTWEGWKDAPEPRPVQGPEAGKILAFPQVGGLHHRYERLAA